MLPVLLAMAITGAITACATAPPKTTAERLADARIADQVETALLADANLYARHIDVSVDRGVAHLGGYVWSIADFRAAQRDAAAVPGVQRVDVEMQLMRGGTSGTSK